MQINFVFVHITAQVASDGCLASRKIFPEWVFVFLFFFSSAIHCEIVCQGMKPTEGIDRSTP